MDESAREQQPGKAAVIIHALADPRERSAGRATITTLKAMIVQPDAVTEC
jgi:hypothetical protein